VRQRKQRVAVLKFDSHYDLAWEPRYWAGSQWARCFEGGYLDPANFAEIGIRGTRNSLAWHEAARELDIGIWTLQDVEEKGIRQCVRGALARNLPQCRCTLSLARSRCDRSRFPAGAEISGSRRPDGARNPAGAAPGDRGRAPGHRLRHGMPRPRFRHQRPRRAACRALRRGGDRRSRLEKGDGGKRLDRTRIKSSPLETVARRFGSRLPPLSLVVVAVGDSPSAYGFDGGQRTTGRR